MIRNIIEELATLGAVALVTWFLAFGPYAAVIGG